jgi:hypothetical protein
MSVVKRQICSLDVYLICLMRSCQLGTVQTLPSPSKTMHLSTLPPTNSFSSDDKELARGLAEIDRNENVSVEPAFADSGILPESSRPSAIQPENTPESSRPSTSRPDPNQAALALADPKKGSSQKPCSKCARSDAILKVTYISRSPVQRRPSVCLQYYL